MSWVFAGVVAIATGAGARADVVWMRGPGGAAAVALRDVTIIRLDGGRVYLRVGGMGGAETVRALSEVDHLTVESEPALSAGETARAVGNWDAATDAYVTFARSATRDDLRMYASERLAWVAVRAGRPEAAVGAYASLVARDPARASDHRPTFAGAKPGVLEAALAAVEKELDPSRPPEQRVALLWLKADLARERGDAGREVLALEQLIVDASDGTAGRATGLLGDLRLAQAQAALSAGNGPSAEAIIAGAQAAFVTPAKQAAAMFLLAQARDRQAKSPSDRATVALGYLRVQALFPDSPEASRSILIAAGLLASAGDADAARKLYQSLAQGDLPLAAEARRALAALP